MALLDHDAEYLIGKFNGWLSAQEGSPTGFDIIRAGDFEVLAGYAINLVGAARLSYPIGRSEGRRGINCDKTVAANPAMRVFAELATAWELVPEEQAALLGIEAVAELVILEGSVMEEVPTAIVERLIALLDIFKALNTLFPIPERADGWLRRPSTGMQFGGRTPLRVMCESKDGIRSVRQYLDAEACSC